MPLSEEFNKRQFDLIHGYLSPEEMNELSRLIELHTSRYYFHRGCENNFFRILENSYNKTALLRDFLRYPLQIEVVIAVSANSNYLTDVLVRNPEFIYRLFDPSHLESVLEINFYRELILNSITRQKTFEAKLHQLKTAKRREILSTGVKDLLSFVDLRRATEELSVMATVICEFVFLICLEKSLSKYGITGLGIDEFSGRKEVDTEAKQLFDKIMDFSVISLGKLGGSELNYSSDIDLIVVFRENFKLPNGKEYFELLHDTIILFTDSTMSMTEAGFLFRVDFRLRPDGHAAPLARTFQDTILYYETRGENWERQMLIKAGFVCGNKKLFQQFINSVTPFIYPSSFFKSPTEQIAALRETKLRNIGDENNIKLFKGGIRDIEFGVQALQMLNGGKNPSVRSGNSLTAIGALAELKILNTEEVDLLTEAYIFYRRIEHYLQLMNDMQTHVIPKEGELLKGLSKFLQFNRPDEFFTKLQDYRTKVRKIYESIIGTDAQDFKEDQDFSTFKDITRAKKNILFLKEGKGLVETKEFDSRTTSLFNEIEGSLIKQLSLSKFPDTALTNLAKIVQRSVFPSYWYEAFKDEFMLDTIVRFCECSQISVDLLTEDHSLKDIVLSGKLFEEIVPEVDFSLSVKSLLFIISSQFVLGFIDEEEVAKILAMTLKIKVKSIISSFDGLNDIRYFIASAGSFSLGEMHFYSDTDLIIVCDDINKYPEIENKFVALLGKLREELSPLSSDCRLRPEGKSGQLVWDIEAYKSYFERRIQIWELQSLTKISFLTGDSKLYEEFTGLILQKVETLNYNSLKTEIFEMRKRLYPTSFSGLNAITDIIKGRGGVTDVEFINQYLLLLNPEYLKFCIGKGNRQILEYLKLEELKSVPIQDEDDTAVQSERYRDYNKLLEGFKFLRKVRLSIQCVYHLESNLFPSKQKGEVLYKFLNYESYEELAKAVQSTLKQNNEIFRQIFNG